MLIELLGALLDACEERGLIFPLILIATGDDGSVLFVLGVDGVDDVEVLSPHDDRIKDPRLPISISVIDAKGNGIRGRIAAEDLH
jgi:hypothetical protein